MKYWSLKFLPQAENYLSKLEREARRRIIDKLDWLLENFFATFQHSAECWNVNFGGFAIFDI